MEKLDGKATVVTGAGIAHVFAVLGAKVLLVDISGTGYDTAKQIVSKGLNAPSYIIGIHIVIDGGSTLPETVSVSVK